MRMGRPRTVSLRERLGNIPVDGAPVERPVEIRWDAHAVPSVAASSERDLAVGLGVVHAHLRLTQMEIMRRLAQGRIAEAIGPAGGPVDHALRLMRIGVAAPGITAMLPEATRRWAEGFVAGVNHVIAGAPALPYEFGLLGIRPEPWTLEHLMQISRLAAADVTWMVFVRLLRGQSRFSAAEWEQLWPSLQAGDLAPWPETAEEAALGL